MNYTVSSIQNTNFDLQCGPTVLHLSRRTHIMGILNITPDSFSDGGAYLDPQRAVSHAYEMAESGADIIDIGAESSKPGSDPVEAEEEIRRLKPVLTALSGNLKLPISVDTYKSQVAEAAIDMGACMINDISGLRADPQMAPRLAKHHVPVVVMHMRGTPKTMQQNLRYENFLAEVMAHLTESIAIAAQAGIRLEQIVIDPGIGFGKSVQHNLQIINRLDEFKKLGQPILVGPSRKSFIGQVLNLGPDEREEGTAAAVACSIMNGAHIVRVHDVAKMSRVARMVDAIRQAGVNDET